MQQFLVLDGIHTPKFFPVEHLFFDYCRSCVCKNTLLFNQHIYTTAVTLLVCCGDILVL